MENILLDDLETQQTTLSNVLKMFYLLIRGNFQTTCRSFTKQFNDTSKQNAWQLLTISLLFLIPDDVFVITIFFAHQYQRKYSTLSNTTKPLTQPFKFFTLLPHTEAPTRNVRPLKSFQYPGQTSHLDRWQAKNSFPLSHHVNRASLRRLRGGNTKNTYLSPLSRAELFQRIQWRRCSTNVRLHAKLKFYGFCCTLEEEEMIFVGNR